MLARPATKATALHVQALHDAYLLFCFYIWSSSSVIVHKEKMKVPARCCVLREKSKWCRWVPLLEVGVGEGGGAYVSDLQFFFFLGGGMGKEREGRGMSMIACTLSTLSAPLLSSVTGEANNIFIA